MKSVLSTSPRGEATDQDGEDETVDVSMQAEAEAPVAMEEEEQVPAGTAALEQPPAPTSDPALGATLGKDSGEGGGEVAEMASAPQEDLAEAQLLSMGFEDKAAVKAALAKNGGDIAASAEELAASAESSEGWIDEWDAMLSDLEEMGFNDRERNKQLLAQNAGDVKKTVKNLVSS